MSCGASLCTQTDQRDEGDEGRVFEVFELVAPDCSTRSKCTGCVAPASSTRPFSAAPRTSALPRQFYRPHLRTRCRPTTTKRGSKVGMCTNFEPSRAPSVAMTNHQPSHSLRRLSWSRTARRRTCCTRPEAGKKHLLYGRMHHEKKKPEEESRRGWQASQARQHAKKQKAVAGRGAAMRGTMDGDVAAERRLNAIKDLLN